MYKLSLIIDLTLLAGKRNAEDNQIFRMDKDKSNNEFDDEKHCFCFFLLHDI